MKLKSLLVLALLALGLGGAEAQSRTGLVVSACGTLPDTYAAGQTRFLTMDTTGAVCMAPAPAATPSAVVGNVASGGTDSGAPVKFGMVFNTTLPTVTTGQRVDAQGTNRGEQLVQLSSGAVPNAAFANNADGVVTSASANKLGSTSFLYTYNGTAWDRQRIGPYQFAQTPITASSGNVANASAAATLAGVAGKTTYISGFQITASGSTAGLDVTATVTGVITGTMSYTFTFPTGALVGGQPLIVTFPYPIPASAVNTAIVVTLPAGGAGNTNATVAAQGFQQ